MASARQPVLRNLLDCGRVRPLSHVQRRWAKVHDVRFVATHRPPVQERYKQKLEQKAADEGHSSLSSLKEAYQDKIQAVRDEEASRASVPPSQPGSGTAATPGAPPQPPSSASTTSSSSSSSVSQSASRTTQSPQKQQQQQQPTTAVPGIKPLSSYLDVDKMKDLPAKEIEALWRLRHVNDPRSICATIPLETYTRIANTARQHPQFILPLPREVPAPQPAQTAETQSGSSTSSSSTSSPSSPADSSTTTAAEMHFLQWGFHPPASPDAASANDSTTTTTSSDSSDSSSSNSTSNTHSSTVIFTHLAQFKLHGTYAEPHTLLTHHLDLADSTGLVLMNGRVVPDRGVSVSEAKLLSVWLQRFYDWGAQGEAGGRKAEILKSFSAGDAQRFRVEELVDEVERV